MRNYLAREQLITAGSTKTALQKFGSTTTTSDILVPGGFSSLNHLCSWYSNAGTAVGALDLLFRTEGNGLPNGSECWTAGAYTIGTVTNDSVAGSGPPPMWYSNVGLPVKSGGNTVQLFGEGVASAGTPTLTMGVLAVFDSASSPTSVTRTYDRANTTTQTDQLYTAQGSNANPPLATPPGISKLARVTFAASSQGGTAAGMLYLLRLAGAGVGGTEIDLPVGMGQSIVGTGPIGIVYCQPFQMGKGVGMLNAPDLDTPPCSPTSSFTANVSNAETNIGSSQTALTLEFV